MSRSSSTRHGDSGLQDISLRLGQGAQNNFFASTGWGVGRVGPPWPRGLQRTLQDLAASQEKRIRLASMCFSRRGKGRGVVWAGIVSQSTAGTFGRASLPALAPSLSAYQHVTCKHVLLLHKHAHTMRLSGICVLMNVPLWGCAASNQYPSGNVSRVLGCLPAGGRPSERRWPPEKQLHPRDRRRESSLPA